MYRVITFQSKEVVDILLSRRIYYADRDKMREGSICIEDILLCCGMTPIWVFQHPAFKTHKVGTHQICNMFETFRCEMSIDSLDGLYCIELHLDRQPPIGKAHNGTSLACIIPTISIEDVGAIYRMESAEHWFFYNVYVVEKFKDNVLFNEDKLFTKEEYSEDRTPEIKLSDYKSAEDYYK